MSSFVKKLDMKVYPSTEAAAGDRKAYGGDEAEWTPDQIRGLSEEMRKGRLSVPLMYEHGDTEASKIGSLKRISFNEADKWMHATARLTCPRRAREVESRGLRGVSLGFAKRIGTDHKRILEVSLTKDPDFSRAKITVIRSHNDQNPDQYLIPLSAGPSVFQKFMSELENIPEATEPEAAEPPAEAPTTSSSEPQEDAPAPAVDDEQPPPFTTEELEKFDKASPEERAQILDQLRRAKFELERTKRQQAEEEARREAEARAEEMRQRQEKLRPTIEKAMRLVSENTPEDQKRQVVGELEVKLGESQMLHAMMNRAFRDNEDMQKQNEELSSEIQQLRQAQAESAALTKRLQEQVEQARHIMKSVEASHKGGFKISPQELIKTHSKKQDSMPGSSLYDTMFGPAAGSSSASSSSSSSSEPLMNSMNEKQQKAERSCSTQSTIADASRDLFSLAKDEQRIQHSRGSKRNYTFEDCGYIVAGLAKEGLLGGEGEAERMRRREQKHGAEGMFNLSREETVMRHSRKKMRFIEAKRHSRAQDTEASLDDSRAVVYRNIRDAIKEFQDHDPRGLEIVTNSMLGRDPLSFQKLIEESYIQRRGDVIPDNRNPGTRGTIDLPLPTIPMLDQLPQSERVKYPKAFFNAAWRAENAKRAAEFNRQEGITFY